MVGRNQKCVCLVFLELLCLKSFIGGNAPKDRTTNDGGCGIVADPKTWNVLRRYLSGCGLYLCYLGATKLPAMSDKALK